MPQLTVEQRARDVGTRIITVRGQKVILDADLAAVYSVTTKALNQAVKRNEKRFPPDFKFHLSQAERAEVVTNCDHLKKLRFSRARPWAFTEHGAIMAATVLKSPRAVDVSVFVVRAFVRLRALNPGHVELRAKLDLLERTVENHDIDLRRVFAALRRLLEPQRKSRSQIGFGSPVTRRGSTS